MDAFVAMNFDRLRSTRTRVAKIARKPAVVAHRRPRSGRATLVPTARSDQSVDKRDWSRGMERGRYGQMRVLFVGHNPSEKSWMACAPYAHPSNSFWKLLRDAEIAPAEMCAAKEYARYPKECGIAFADLFVTSGSLASAVNAPVGWGAEQFCARIARESGGLAPHVVACVSKGVAKKLLKGWDGEFGAVGDGVKWKLNGLQKSQVWVLPSTSGRAGMKWEQRVAPFKLLAETLKEYPWPLGREAPSMPSEQPSS